MPQELTTWRRLALVMLLCVSIILVAHEEYRRGQPRLVVLDVGQGDALYIRTPEHQDILIDAGRGDQVISQLTREMPYSDRTIELAIATHFDADHIGGFEPLLKQMTIKLFATNGATPTTKLGNEVMELATQEPAELIVLHAGARVSGDSYLLDVLWPRDGSESANKGSLVALLKTAQASVMLTGDADSSVERSLIASGADLKADVLKVGHHGSKSSSSTEFLQSVGGARALISVGATNRYGHPTEEVIERLTQAGYAIERTDQDGSITVPL